MITLIKNEAIKLKRQPFLIFLALLATFPVFIGGARTLIGGNSFTLAELFFFVNNQFAMFFPMTIFILVGSLFYTEYKNGTYITFINYGYSKTLLYLSKLLLAILIGLSLAILTVLIFAITTVIAHFYISPVEIDVSWVSLLIGFALQSTIVILLSSCIGAIIIILSKNMIVSSAVSVFYGFVSVLFIGMESGYFIPGSFAYRLCMYFVDSSSYYDNSYTATIFGVGGVIIVMLTSLFLGMLVFSRKKLIES